MRIIFSLIFFLLLNTTIGAQDKTVDTVSLNLPDSNFVIVNDTAKPPGMPVAATGAADGLHNSYGDLLNDDPAYNKRYSWVMTAARVALANGVTWAASRYIFDYDWSHISGKTWSTNLHSSWVWDNDHFGTNFIGHPHSGNIYFNIARSNGYSYWSSLPFAIGGSLMWEYFGENTLPSKNDIINTPISGAFLGEVLYRISSNILDDRARGANRVWRELLAGILNPPRALNRLTQGKMFRVTNKEVYQKDRLNVMLSAGLHKVNADNKFGTGVTNYIVNLQLDYGDPFEVRHRKPFDVFRLRTESSFGIHRKFLDNVTGYGILFGKNVTHGEHGLLLGAFQYFDYWNNRIFELGSIGFGVGLISRVPIKKSSNLYSSLHFAAVPLAGNNTSFGPDSSLFRDYNFGGGLEAKIEETLNLGKFASVGFSGYYYWITNYEGPSGNSLVGILKPRVVINLSKSVSIGGEHHVYFNDRYINHIPAQHLVRTEQKVFLQVFFEDSKRRGKYH